MPPGPDAIETIIVERVAQFAEERIIDCLEKTRLNRNAIDAVFACALEKIPHRHGLVRCALQVRINLAEVAMVTIRIDGDFHAAIVAEHGAANKRDARLFFSSVFCYKRIGVLQTEKFGM